jgi:hypothetical protein
MIIWLGAVLVLGHLLSHVAAANPCAGSAAFAAAAANLDVQEQAIAAQFSTPDTSLKVTDLPLSRPLQPWPYRSISTAIEAPYPTTNTTNGVTFSRLQHAPIQNVTAGLMLWWFRSNLERVVHYPWDGGNYTRYQIWHPRDHCHQKRVNQTTWLLQVNSKDCNHRFLLATRSSAAIQLPQTLTAMVAEDDTTSAVPC